MKQELPRGWELKKLGDYCEIFNGKTPSKKEQRVDGHPILKIKDMDETGYFLGKFDSFVDDVFFEQNKKKCLKNGDTVILNAAHNSEYVGSKKCFISDFQDSVIPTGEWLIVRSSSNLLNNQYKHFLLSSSLFKLKIKKMVKGIHLYPKDIKLLDFPLPPLEIQHKIVSILEKTEATKQCRVQADELTNQLLQSVFLEMFGDPAKNPKGWEIKKMETEIDDIRYGTGSPPEYQKEGIPFIRATNIKRGTIQKEGLVYISEDEARKIPKCQVKTGDLILVRSGVNTGDCAVIPYEYNGAYAAYDLIIEIPYPKNYYYDFLINSEYGKSIITPLSRRAGQPHINAEQVKSLGFQLPPIHLLENFVQFVEKVKTMRNNQIQSKKENDILFNNLMQKAFTGELVA